MCRSLRFRRWLVLVAASSILPAFVMRCDKAALNFQRGLFLGLGQDVSGLIVEQATGLTDAAE